MKDNKNSLLEKLELAIDLKTTPEILKELINENNSKIIISIAKRVDLNDELFALLLEKNSSFKNKDSIDFKIKFELSKNISLANISSELQMLLVNKKYAEFYTVDEQNIIEELSKNPFLATPIITSLINYPYKNIRKNLLSLPNIDTESIMVLSFDEDDDVAKEARNTLITSGSIPYKDNSLLKDNLKNPTIIKTFTDDEIICKYSYLEIIQLITENKASNEEILTFAKIGKVNILVAIANSSKLDDTLFCLLMSYENDNINLALASNSSSQNLSSASQIKLINSVLEDDSSWLYDKAVLKEFAKNASIKKEVALILAQSNEKSVREVLVDNSNIDSDILKILSYDHVEEISLKAKKRLYIPKVVIAPLKEAIYNSKMFFLGCLLGLFTCIFIDFMFIKNYEQTPVLVPAWEQQNPMPPVQSENIMIKPAEIQEFKIEKD